MKKNYILLLLAALLFTSNFSFAAFVPKTHTPIVATTPSAEATDAAPTAQPTPADETMATQPTEHKAEKQSFIKRLVKKAHAVVPLLLYIVMAFLPLGWLAMGLNDDFEGFDWILSLILYLCFYIPGIIYTLIMTGKYY